MKKKLTGFLLCVTLIAAGSITASADNEPAGLAPAAPSASVSVSTEVPAGHIIKVIIKGNGTVKLDGTESSEFSAARQSRPAAEIAPAAGGKLVKLTYNGEDVTARVKDGAWTLPPVNRNGELVAEFEDAPAPAPAPVDPDDGGKDKPPSTGVVGGVSVGTAALLGILAAAKLRRKDGTDKK